mmetsp:Transcript_9673/g.29263  ORF Transcript_9673/g.29263 Transcript_9673/m.29263 type:complete len:467 (-) Transcript_9673:199-1599(-)
MLAVRTERYKYLSRDDAVAEWSEMDSDARRLRDCSTQSPPSSRNGRPGTDLGSGSLPNGAPNSAPFLTPKQYVMSQGHPGMEVESILTPANLGITFVTMPNPKITTIRFQEGDLGHAQIFYRVTGKAYFRPVLLNWPFDKQRLEVLIEFLDMTTDRDNLSFVSCTLANYTGISPSVRFPNFEQQLSYGTEINPWCWPPYHVPFSKPGAQHQTEDAFVGVHTTPGGEAVCYEHGGAYPSSRFNFFVEYSSPWLQRFVKTYLPIIMVNFILAMSYLLPAKDYSQRIAICIGTLTALVLFHVALETQLPSNKTVTLAGYFLVCSYVMNGATWAVAIFFMLCMLFERPVTAAEDIARFCGPTVIIMVTAVCASFRAPDYAQSGNAAGKLVGAAVGAFVMGYIFHRVFFWAREQWMSMPHKPWPWARSSNSDGLTDVLELNEMDGESSNLGNPRDFDNLTETEGKKEESLA